MRFCCCRRPLKLDDRVALLAGLLLMAGLLAGVRVHGHGDVHRRIDALTAEIARSPQNAELYVKRSELWQSHGEWRKAEADLRRAARRDPGWAGIDLARGRLWLETGRPRAAERVLTRHLAAQPESAQAWLWRARARVRLGDYVGAASDFDQALGLGLDTDPEVYVERAAALVDAGSPHQAAALRGLEEALRRLGPAVTLELAAVDMEELLGQWDGAIARLDRLLETASRKESWLLRKAEILERAGRLDAAKITYAASLEAIARLPESLRNLPATRRLQAQACLRLATLPAAGSAGWSRAGDHGF